MDTLRSIITPKGTALHLVKVGEQYTLCGRHTGLNPKLTSADFSHTTAPANANCGKCLKAAE